MGAKFKTPKNPKGFQHNPQKSLDQKLTPKNSTLKHVCLYFIHRTTQPKHYHDSSVCFKYPFHPYLNHKNTSQIFLPKKIPQLQISNPKKSFDHSCHFKMPRAPPLGVKPYPLARKRFLGFGEGMGGTWVHIDLIY